MTDTDVAGYMVYREKGDQIATLVSSPLVVNWFLDTRPNTTGENTYLVSCLDTEGNESEYTSIAVTIDTQRDQHRDIRPELPMN